jgi:hypothetical protein
LEVVAVLVDFILMVAFLSTPPVFASATFIVTFCCAKAKLTKTIRKSSKDIFFIVGCFSFEG